MITITIDNPEMERVFYEDFNGDNNSFVEFLSHECCINNTQYNNEFSKIETILKDRECHEDSGYTFDEAVNVLEKKYAN